MPRKPQAFDYESIYPSRRSRSPVSEGDVEAWLPSGRVDSEDDRHRLLEPSGSKGHAENPGFPTESENWILKRGHVLSYAGLFLFTVVLYVRPYELFPGLSFLKSVAFYLALATLLVFLPTQLSTEGNLTARPREVNLALLFGLAALLSMPLAIAPGEAWTTFIDGSFAKALIMFVVMVNVVRTERRLKWLLVLAFAVCIVLSINAIDDYRHGLFGMGTIENSNQRIKGSIGGLFENPNDLALHFVTMIPIAIALALSSRQVPTKIVYVAVAISMVAGIVVTFSRGGFLGLIAIVLVLAWKLGRQNRATALLGVLLAAVLFVGFAPGDYKGRVATVLNSSADLTGSSSQRSEILQRAVVVALRYPIFGVGVGNFHYRSSHELGTHNAYAQVAAEMGLTAMVIYMMFIISPLRRLRQIERETSLERRNRFYYMAVGLQASLAGYMVASFFAAVAYQWYVYYLVGYAIALRRIYATTNSEGSNSSAPTARNATELTPDSSGLPHTAGVNRRVLT